MNLFEFDVNASLHRCRKYRRRILDISQTVTALHAAPAFSCIEIVDAVYNILMRHKKDGILQDSFVMSKGHGVMSQYVVLEDLGILQREELDRYCKANGHLGAHPDIGQPGIEASTGSLGHGLSIAVGMAYADKIQGTDRITYVLLGDGEIQEGSIWEAIMMAPNLDLGNLIVFLDFNNYQSLGRTTETHPHLLPLTEKVNSFGWEATEVNGHDTSAIVEAMRNRKGGQPFFVTCRTIKGNGVSYMIDKPIWHYRSPNKDEYELALGELSSKEVNG